jgi:hypothetical protein
MPRLKGVSLLTAIATSLTNALAQGLKSIAGDLMLRKRARVQQGKQTASTKSSSLCTTASLQIIALMKKK